MREKLVTLKSELERNFKERHDEIAGALLGVVSGEHVVLLGPPGTAKSLLARKVCEALDGGDFFYYLLTRFTTPDEVFGPLSIKALQEDRFHRKVEKSLPTAHVAFLDEIFKANSSILNSLLTILNERKFHNGQEVIDVPLLSVFGASNELPEESERESLEALYDRFLLRYFVVSVQEEANFSELVFGKAEDYRPSVRIGVSEVLDMQRVAEEVGVGDDVKMILLELRRRFRSENIPVSDRRWKKIVRILRVGAACLGHKSVDRTMALLLQHMLWSIPEQRDRIRKMVLDLVVSGGVNLDELRKDAKGLKKTADESTDYRFLESVRCANCSKDVYTWRQVEDHKRSEASHTFRTPRQSNYYSGESDLTVFRQKLQKEFGWDVTLSIPDERRKIYRKELYDLRAQANQARRSLESERDELNRALVANIWISDRDRSEVLALHEGKRKVLSETEADLGLIEKALEALRRAPTSQPQTSQQRQTTTEDENSDDL